MLSVPRQVLRVSRQVQTVTSFRTYVTDNNNNNNNGAKPKSEGVESLMSILGSNSTKNTTNTHTNTSTTASPPSQRGSSTEMIMETLSKVTDRYAHRSGNATMGTGFLNNRTSTGGFRHVLNETQTASHNLHIHASMNNTILTLTDSAGDPITTQSAGSAGFKKSARSGPEAGYQAMTKLIEKVEEKNVQITSLHVLMKGFGPGRDSAFKAIRAKTQWDIKRISDTTPIPFNGCRPPKARRL